MSQHHIHFPFRYRYPLRFPSFFRSIYVWPLLYTDDSECYTRAVIKLTSAWLVCTVQTGCHSNAPCALQRPVDFYIVITSPSSSALQPNVSPGFQYQSSPMSPIHRHLSEKPSHPFFQHVIQPSYPRSGPLFLSVSYTHLDVYKRQVQTSFDIK